MNLSPLLVKWAAVAVIGTGTGFAAGYQWASVRSVPAENAPTADAADPGSTLANRPQIAADQKPATPRRAGPRETIASVFSERDSYKKIKRFRRLLMDLRPEEFAEAYRQLTGSGVVNDWRQIGLLSEFLGDWAEHDPLQALEKAKSFKMHELRPILAAQVLGVLARRDPDAALALLAKEPEGNRKRTMQAALIGALAETDPARARALLREHPEAIRGGGAYSVFSQWATRDPLGAIDAAHQLGNASLRSQALQAIGSTWALADPQAAQAWVNTLPAGKLRDQLWLNLVRRKAQNDPAAAVESLLAADLRESTRQRGMQTALLTWGAQDRDAALAFVLEEGSPKLNQSVLPSILSQWMESDPSEALDWLRQHRTETGGTAFLETMTRMAAHQNPENALQLLGELPEGDARRQLHHQIAASFAESDLGAAQAHLAKMPPGPERDQYQQGMITGMAAQDPERAMREVDALPEGAMQNRLRQSLMNTLADTDPRMAIDWAAKAPEKSRGAMLGTAVSVWANSDPYAASAWLATLPQGASRDQAVSSFSSSVSRTDPQGAATWALSISDEKLRANAVRRVATQWKRADEAAAKQWIQGADLPEKLKTSLLR